MYITQCYKYEVNGVIYVGGTPPQDATILETMDILNADDGYNLIRKSDGEKLGANVWLKDCDTQDNYIEIPEPQDDESNN